LGTSCKQGTKQESGPLPRPPEQIGAPSLAASQAGGITDTEPRGYYKARCASCHGETGRGDGPGLALLKLKNKPRDYMDAGWQRTVTDDQIRKIILYGGASNGLSSDMPAFGDLQGKPALLDELTAIIRSFGKG
jgi:mono/diheme cytochrome c family protein